MTLTTIQYDVIMEAINNAKAELAADTFIDPYAEQSPDYTNETLLKALIEVENLIITTNTPT